MGSYKGPPRKGKVKTMRHYSLVDPRYLEEPLDQDREQEDDWDDWDDWGCEPDQAYEEYRDEHLFDD